MDNLSLWQLFIKGGPVMWPIFLASVFSLAIVLEKFLYLHKIKINSRNFLNKIIEQIKRNDIKEALQICDNTQSPLAQILKAGILKYDRPRPQIIESIQDASLYEVPKLQKNLSLLAAIGNIAPLLGFLGTLVGMIKCFQVIQVKVSLSHPVLTADLAAGIWQALVTAFTGLAVAIPIYIVYNYFVNRINSLVLEMEKASTELVNSLTEERL